MLKKNTSTRGKLLAEAAREYRDNHHWVPLRLNGKAPCDAKWPKRTLKDALPRYGNNDNLGIVLGEASENLIRLDPDFESIPEVTSVLFPEPTLMFGRATSPRSGRLYTCAVKSTNFKLPKSMAGHPGLPQHDGKPGLVVFQILSSGKQTMAPPSVHPDSGEKIVWQSEASPAAIEAAELMRRVGIEAFLMAVRQFWPPRGTRNEAAMALARVLLEAFAARHPDEVERCAIVDELVVAVAMAGGDGEESRKGKEARAAKTLEKMRSGEEKTTGMPRLLELLELPENVAKTFRGWLGLGAALGERLDSSLPTIYCMPGQIPLMTNAAEEALIKAGAEIYAHGGQLVQPVIEETDAAHGRKTMVARLRPMIDVTMVEAMSATATWLRKNAEGFWKRTDPPTKIAKTLLEREARWHLRRIVGIVTCPTLRPNGSLLSVPGYDPETRLLLVSPPPMPAIPEKPTKVEATAALDLLDGLLREFPFIDATSRSVALSMMLTTVCRGVMMCAPAHVITAPEAGTGKSYLINIPSTIATGRECPVIAAGRNEEETEKRLVALLIKGQPLVSIDNVNGELKGDLMCQMITQRMVDVRVLGLSKIITVDNHVTLFCNGNNIQITGDLVRRVVRCCMDAGVERPEIRKFIGNPIDAVLANRGRYIAAALTVVRAYIVAGRPGAKGLEPFQGFDGWNDNVRGALVWLGKEDPTKSVEGARDEDPGRATLVRVMAAIGKLNAMTAGELAKWAERKSGNGPYERAEYENPELHAALLEVANDHHGHVGAAALGQYLGQNKNRVLGGYKIVRHFDKKLKQIKWEVQEVPPPESPTE